MLDFSYIQSAVKNIEKVKGDAEVAHSMEDEMYRMFVEWVSNTGTVEQTQMAKELLKTKEINFPRWCA